MNVTVYCLDHDDALERRLAYYEAHKAYLDTAPIKTLISGPLTTGRHHHDWQLLSL